MRRSTSAALSSSDRLVVEALFLAPLRSRWAVTSAAVPAVLSSVRTDSSGALGRVAPVAEAVDGGVAGLARAACRASPKPRPPSRLTKAAFGTRHGATAVAAATAAGIAGLRRSDRGRGRPGTRCGSGAGAGAGAGCGTGTRIVSGGPGGGGGGEAGWSVRPLTGSMNLPARLRGSRTRGRVSRRLGSPGS